MANREQDQPADDLVEVKSEYNSEEEFVLIEVKEESESQSENSDEDIFLIEVKEESQSDVENEQNEWRCDVCHVTYKRRPNLISHLRRHLAPRATEATKLCVHCGRQFNRVDFIVHVQSHRTHACICGKSYANRSSLTRHVQTHHVSPRLIYRCNLCDKTLTTKQSLLSHMHRGHRDVKSINEYRALRNCKCKKCGKAFTSNRNLLKHTSDVHPVQRLQCDACKKTFKAKKHLMVHIKVAHGENSLKYQCDQCNRKFTHQLYLSRHRRSVHTGKRACGYCRKVFKSKEHLSRHQVRKHRKISLECDICGKSLRSRASLVAHFKRYHPFVY